MILPTATAGVAPAVVETADVWSQSCNWHDGAQMSSESVALIIRGALTGSGVAGLNASLGTEGTTQTMAVAGVGDKAEYVNLTSVLQRIRARVGNYLVEVVAFNFTVDVTEARLEPLAVKAVAGLHASP